MKQRMGRQTINGTEYVFEYTTYWNKEKKRTDKKRTYIGKVVDGAFKPNLVYQLRKELEEERAKHGQGGTNEGD
jgi:hypothetical protein